MIPAVASRPTVALCKNIKKFSVRRRLTQNNSSSSLSLPPSSPSPTSRGASSQNSHHPPPASTRRTLTAMSAPNLTFPSTDIPLFSAHLQKSTRILALLGAGLSASSGLPTFRGAGGIWRDREATSLATPEAFRMNPGLVWQFYSYRRHMALAAQPNAAHYALAELARRKEGFVTLSQNVDGLSQRAGHPAGQLRLLHGNLFDIKCSNYNCSYFQSNNYTDPIVPALAIPTEGPQPEPSASGSSSEAASNLLGAVHYSQKEQEEKKGKELDISNANVAIPRLHPKDLPRCKKCNSSLLRPGVVWFGEALPRDVIEGVEAWMDEGPIDLMLVVGTSAKVYPAAGYIDEARDRGARIAVVNIEGSHQDADDLGLSQDDWFFVGDAAKVVPEICRAVIGDVQGPPSSL